MIQKQSLWYRVVSLLAPLLLVATMGSSQESISVDSLALATVEGDHRVTILLCTPSQADAYTIYGHAAIRVSSLEDPVDDYVYNYGVFDFDQPGFYYKFIKGETDGYFVQKETWDSFLYRYHLYGDDIYELELDLPEVQIDRILSYLEWNIQEENKYYLYNFVFDNCATRLYTILTETLPEGWRINLPKVTEQKSLRTLINDYADNYRWYRVGTDLALGSPADTIMTVKDRLFLPMEMDRILQKATIESPEGITTLLVKQRYLYASSTPAPSVASSWWLEPILWFALLLLVSGVLYYLKRTRYWIIFWMTVYACLGFIVSFLSFISIHPCTDPNYNLLIFHPLLLCVWFTAGKSVRSQRIARIFHSFNAVAVALYLILIVCFVQTTSLAIILLALHSGLLSVGYLTSLHKISRRI